MQKDKEKMKHTVFSIKIKNIFQKIRYSKEIALSSIADKENRRISLTGRCPLVSRKIGTLMSSKGKLTFFRHARIGH